MIFLSFMLMVLAFGCLQRIDAIIGQDPMVCNKTSNSTIYIPRLRRYDISDPGYEEKFHGWADVQGQGAANDYCRIVGSSPELFLACALAGTHGKSEYNYKSATGFDVGYSNTWYMRDEDGDGRDDYCRCVGAGDTLAIACTKAGEHGFYGSSEQGGATITFVVARSQCNTRKVRPEFGR